MISCTMLSPKTKYGCCIIDNSIHMIELVYGGSQTFIVFSVICPRFRFPPQLILLPKNKLQLSNPLFAQWEIYLLI